MRSLFWPERKVTFQCTLSPEQFHATLNSALNQEASNYHSFGVETFVYSYAYMGYEGHFQVEEFSSGIRTDTTRLIGNGTIEKTHEGSIVTIAYYVDSTYLKWLLPLFFAIGVLALIAFLTAFVIGDRSTIIGIFVAIVFCAVPFLNKAYWSGIMTSLHSKMLRALKKAGRVF